MSPSQKQPIPLFDELEDETPPSTGQEIGAAISDALSEVSKSNTILADKLLLAINQAMQEALNKQEVKIQPVQRWIFSVERNSDKLMTRIIATADK